MSQRCLGQFYLPNDTPAPQGTPSLRAQVIVFRVTSLVLLSALLFFASGCAAMKPLNGIPARYMPNAFKPSSRSGKKTINLSLLRQTPPPRYLLDSGDVLAIYIEGVLGDRRQVPPVHFPQNQQTPPSFGFPIPVRDDGTISLPMSQPIDVRGMTVGQVEQAIRKRLTVDKNVLKPGRERILVSLQRPRSYRVLVIRQEAGASNVNITSGGRGQVNPGVLKRGAGQVVALPAYQNDVLHALAKTGGLPGLDAENAIYIIRNGASQTRQQQIPIIPPSPSAGGRGLPQSRRNIRRSRQTIRQVSHTTVNQHQSSEAPLTSYAGPQFGGHSEATNGAMFPQAGFGFQNGSFPHSGFSSSGGMLDDPTVGNPNIIRIPVRLSTGEYPQFSEQDIILQDGDIVFIETRETEIFYTGGLLGGGQYTLPRDYDLDILGAISIAESTTQGGGSSGGGRQTGGVSALNQDVTIGASNVVILRTLPNGKQVPIQVDLYKALRNPEERIAIQPGDYIVLQYTKWEATWAFMERHLLEGALFTLSSAQLTTGN